MAATSTSFVAALGVAGRAGVDVVLVAEAIAGTVLALAGTASMVSSQTEVVTAHSERTAGAQGEEPGRYKRR